MQNSTLENFIFQGNLVKRIIIGIILGIIIAAITPYLTGMLGFNLAEKLGFLGTLFVRSLKSVAPILVFIIVTSAIANHKANGGGHFKPIIVLYLLGTFLAAVTAVIASFLFPTEIILKISEADLSPPQHVAEVLSTLVLNVLDNPVNALLNANFIGILAWALGIGFALRYGSESTKVMFNDLSNGITLIVKTIIAFAPLGVFGLVAQTLASSGFEALLGYAQLLMVLIGSMLFVAFVINPILVYWQIGRNPYPLVFTCLKESGITAFLTRSSAANIPVNMSLAERLNLDKETYSISIPLGATINMAGAAITITVLTLAAVHTLGIEVSIITAILLSVIASICACGASGVAGGSLLLIPLACSLFGVSNDIAAQVIAVGFIIGVLQDSTETALNSSTDVLFTAAACMGIERKENQK